MARMLAMIPVHLVRSTGHKITMFSVGIHMSSSVPFDNKHRLIVNLENWRLLTTLARGSLISPPPAK
jgi:hypothetical protein